MIELTVKLDKFLEADLAAARFASGSSRSDRIIALLALACLMPKINNSIEARARCQEKNCCSDSINSAHAAVAEKINRIGNASQEKRW